MESIITNEKDERFIELTKELIQKLTPTMVICLGKDDCMLKLIKSPKTLIDDGELLYGEINSIPIYGIPHTSKYYTNEESTMLGEVLASLYKKEVLPEKAEISNRFKDVIKAFKDRKEHKNVWGLNNYKIIGVKYTPDFTFNIGDRLIVIEIKGFSNDRYPYQKKLFFKWLEDNTPNSAFFEIHNMKQLKQALEILKEWREKV